tara:strand:+ start:291 stop:542 length:252 start_codon:yes stop_codon:yes gene_type:complete
MSDEIRTIGLAMISTRDIRAAVEDTDISIILTLEEAAGLARCAPQTLRKHVSEGQYKDCVSRGKPLLFFRDKFIKEVMKDNPE